MLETVLNDCKELMSDNASFHDFYQSYIMYIQDQCIEREIAYMLSHNVVSIELLDRAISEACKGMWWSDD